jgi:hypothetical protein
MPTSLGHFLSQGWIHMNELAIPHEAQWEVLWFCGMSSSFLLDQWAWLKVRCGHALFLSLLLESAPPMSGPAVLLDQMRTARHSAMLKIFWRICCCNERKRWMLWALVWSFEADFEADLLLILETLIKVTWHCLKRSRTKLVTWIRWKASEGNNSIESDPRNVLQLALNNENRCWRCCSA